VKGNVLDSIKRTTATYYCERRIKATFKRRTIEKLSYSDKIAATNV
jgi:hypothetical protein